MITKYPLAASGHTPHCHTTVSTCEWTHIATSAHEYHSHLRVDTHCYKCTCIYTIPMCEWTHIATSVHIYHSHLRVDIYFYKCTCRPFPPASGHTSLEVHMNTIPMCEWTYIATSVHVYHSHLRVDTHHLKCTCIYTIPTCEWTHITRSAHVRVDIYCYKGTCIPFPPASGHLLLHTYIIIHLRVDMRPYCYS